MIDANKPKPPFGYTPQALIQDLRSTAEILRIGATKKNTNELLARKMEAAAYYLEALVVQMTGPRQIDPFAGREFLGTSNDRLL